MKAALFYKPQEPLKIEDVPKPEPMENEVLVKVSSCGICATDLHYIDEGVPTFKKPPIILGHEPSGIVETVGSSVKNLRVGDRVIIPPVFSCGVCENCRRGRENICEAMIMMGNHIDGAYAEYVAVPAKDCILIPQELELIESSIIADALSTPFHAVRNRAQVKPGEKVVVFGCGGVGINIVQFASAIGGIVTAVDLSEKKLILAKELGATNTVQVTKESEAKHTFNLTEKKKCPLSESEMKSLLKEIRELTSGGADVCFEAIGNPQVIEMAFNSVKTGGRLCIVGYSKDNVPINMARLMFREMTVLGSLGCRPVDYPAIIELVRIGKIKLTPLISNRFKLEAINDAFELLRKGEAIRSIVIP